MKDRIAMLFAIAGFTVIACALLYGRTGSLVPVWFTVATTAIGTKWLVRAKPPVMIVPAIAANAILGFITWKVVEVFAS